MSRTKYPETVPVLEGRHFCRGAFMRGSRRCLLGWAGTVFSGRATGGIPGSVERRLRIEVNKSVGDRHETIAGFNDNKENRLDLLAKIWNRAMAKLGYVVGNPEADSESK